MSYHSISANRRRLLQTLAAGVSGLALFKDALAKGSSSTNNDQNSNMPRVVADTEVQKHLSLLALRYGSRNTDTYWWLQGRRYASISNELVPLFDIWVGFAYRRFALDDTADRLQIRSRVLYTRLDSEELLTAWHNPLTERTVKFHYPSPTTQEQQYLFSNGLQRPTLSAETRQERDDQITGLRHFGKRVFIDEEARVRVFNRARPDQSPRKVHDRYMWSGTRSSNDTQTDTFISGEVSFMDVTDWSPRLEMGDTPGCAIAHCSGQRTSTLDDFPALWHRLHVRHQLDSLVFQGP